MIASVLTGGMTDAVDGGDSGSLTLGYVAMWVFQGWQTERLVGQAFAIAVV